MQAMPSSALLLASLLLSVHAYSFVRVSAASGWLARRTPTPGAASLLSAMAPSTGACYYDLSKRYEGIAVEDGGNSTSAVEITVVSKGAQFTDLMSKINETDNFKLLQAVGFVSQSFPGNGKLLLLPDSANTSALRHYAFYDPADNATKSSFKSFDGLFSSLTANTTYRIVPYCLAGNATEIDSTLANKLMMCQGMSSYRLTELGFKSRSPPSSTRPFNASGNGSCALVVWPPASDRTLVRAMVSAHTLFKDMVDTPAMGMGPAEIETILRALGADYGCNVTSIVGVPHLLDGGFPLVAAVGMAAAEGREPRVVELKWRPGDAPADVALPIVAIVGKGVTFDTGGLNIKGGGGMRNMKRDMAGSAVAAALALLLMALKVPVELHLIVPIAENAIAGNALRPGDIVRSRNGLTIEITNTDAEGRLLLADAITLAMENSPDLLVDFATLTGAARVALGNDLPAVFSNDRSALMTLWQQGDDVGDPVWPMPLYEPSRESIRSSIADLVNAADAGGGAITAALFLSEFVAAKQVSGAGGEAKKPTWLHLDFQGSRGGAADPQGLRCVLEYIQRRFAGGGRSAAAV